MTRKIRVAVLGSHGSMQRLVDRGDFELFELFDPQPHDITIPLWETEHARFVEDVQPDFLVCINTRLTTRKCNAWLGTLRSPGTKALMWGLDSYRHTVVEHDRAARYWYCLDDDLRAPGEPYLPVYAQPRPIVPLERRTHRCGIVCNRYGGFRDAEIAKVAAHLDFAGTAPFDRYHETIAGFRYGLNIATHYDGLPNYRTFELAAAGVWQICSSRNRGALESLLDYGVSYYDRVEELPAILAGLGDYDPARIQRQVATRHTLAHRIRTMLADFGVDFPVIEEDGAEWSLEDYRRRARTARPTQRGEPAPPAPRRVGEPLVSVLVPCFRSARFLERSVRSALAQTATDLEVVVVDNASDDDTWAIAQRLAAEDPRVRVFRNESNVGPVRNWRRAAELARGRYAALLFSDDWYQPEFLAEALPLLEQDAGVGFAYSTVRVVFEDVELRPSGELRSYRLDGPATRPTSEFLAEILERGMQGVPVSPGCALARRPDLAAWLAHELPDPHGAGYLAHGAGPDLWVYLQACQAYPRFGHLQQPRVNFAAHPDNLTWKPGIQAAYALSRLAFLLTHRPPSVDAQAALAHCWLSLRQDLRRAAVAPHLGLAAWLRLGEEERRLAADAGRRAEVEARVAEDAAQDPRAIPGLPAAVFQPIPPTPPGSPYAVTAIVSAFKATRFLRGCLEDLLGQTLHAQGRLEILVVDTGSPEDEGAVVREFLPRSPHLRYLRTEDRRTLYQAWNLGVLEARGRYLTNANADDRHRPDALERLAAALDAAPDVGLVYADSLVSSVENDTFATTTSRARMSWGPFGYPALRRQCFMGPHPMWRRSLHERFGLFDGDFTSAGDWEFWLRVGRSIRMQKVEDCLGLYFLNPQGLEHGNQKAGLEAGLVRQRHGIANWEVTLGPNQVRFDAWDPARHERPERPLVSVVVTAPRPGDLLSKALAGVALQTCRDLELVLVEERPGEGSDLLRQVLRHSPGLRHRTVRAAGGWAAARNAGVAAADGRFIAPLGERDFLEPEYLERLLEALAAEPKAGVAFSDDSRDGKVHENGPFEAGALSRRDAAASTAVYHRNVFAALGPFPEAPGVESDRELWRRAAARGVQAVRVPLPLFHSARPAPAPFRARVVSYSQRWP